MFKRYFSSFISIFFLASINLSAETLKNSIAEAINTNPVVVERLKNYRALQQELSISESKFYPKLELDFSVNSNRSLNSLSATQPGTLNNSYSNYKSALTLTQNIFEGFSTKYDVASKEAKILAAAYSYMSVANAIALKMATAYVNVFRTDELVKVAFKNKKISEYIYKIVANRYDNAQTSFSEVKRVESALYLAKSNLLHALKESQDSKFQFRKILGRMPDVSTMQRVNFNVQVAENAQEASQYAINNNPLLLMSHYNIKDAQYLRKKAQGAYYPKVDLQLTQNYSDVKSANLYEYPDDRFRATLSLKYNLFNGGVDSANVQKSVSVMNKVVAKRRAIKRSVIEELDVAWNSYAMSKEELVNLQQYKANSEQTLKFFQQEYLASRRSILELLDAAHDLFYTNTLYINTKYDELVAKYRILSSMGLLVTTLVGDDKRFSSNVNLNTQREARVVLDSPLISLDIDKDRIADNNDLCDNSLLENNIMPYGCRKITTFAKLRENLDSPSASVIPHINVKQQVFSSDHYYSTRTPKVQTVHRRIPSKKTRVQKYHRKRTTTRRDSTENSSKSLIQLRKSYQNDDYAKSTIPDDLKILPKHNFIKENMVTTKDMIYGKHKKFYGDDGSSMFTKEVSSTQSEDVKCVNIPSDYNVNSDGCATSVTISLPYNFQKSSTKLSNNLLKKIIELAGFLKKNPKIYAHIVGYSSRTSRSNYDFNIRISKRRADRFKDELIKYGVAGYRLSTEGQGFNNPIADNSTIDGRELNRRVEIKFSH